METSSRISAAPKCKTLPLLHFKLHSAAFTRVVASVIHHVCFYTLQIPPNKSCLDRDDDASVSVRFPSVLTDRKIKPIELFPGPVDPSPSVYPSQGVFKFVWREKRLPTVQPQRKVHPTPSCCCIQNSLRKYINT